VPAERGRLPTGGAAALMFASTPEKQQAAWKFIKFITDATGATGDNFINDRSLICGSSRRAPLLDRVSDRQHPQENTYDEFRG
jgi:hypothetical protein